MTSRAVLIRIAAAAAVLAALASPVRADAPLAPERFTRAKCAGSPADGTAPIDTTPGAIPAPAVNGPTVPWNELALEGTLFDASDTVRDLLLPAFKKLQTASEPERTLGMAAAVTLFGYQLVDADARTTPAGVTAVLRLAPLPVVRRVSIKIKDRTVGEALSTALLDEDVRRRMQTKPGNYLPWRPDARTCKLIEEKVRIEDFLHDEGYYDAAVVIGQRADGPGTDVEVEVHLGEAYSLGRIEIVHPNGPLDISDYEIRSMFVHAATSLLSFKIGTARFTRARHQLDLQAVIEKFHKKGYPTVRVTSDYSPTGSFDRRTKKVNFKVVIDPRRFLDVQFENIDFDAVGISNDQLREQLTFDKAGSSDDVEATASANALAAYLQTRGHFDARVTWTRQRLADSATSAGADQLHYRIDLGPSRTVQSVELAGVKAIPEADLRELIFTKANRFSGTLFGTNASATSVELAGDVERIVEAYKRAGYRDARVQVTAATDPAALDSAALAAALVSADHGAGLYVRFTVDEGSPTLLARVELTIDGDTSLCEPMLGKLAELLGDPNVAHRAAGGGCVATIPNLKFHEVDAVTTGDALRDWLWNRGNSRAVVDYRWEVEGPHRVVARYQIRHTDPLLMGKVVVRGNFRTRTQVILDELHLRPGKPLTADSVAEGARRLRAMGLFDSVNLQLPNLCSNPDPSCVPAGSEVNAVVVVQERYDYFATVELSGGFSSYSGVFATIGPSQRNLFGLGISADGAFTYGTKILSVDGTLRIPKWLVRDYFTTELTGFVRNQDTPNFGEVQTEGASIAVTETPVSLQRKRTATQQARVIAFGQHYDFRLRGRNVDALRPIGVAGDQSQVPISTRTGSVGLSFDWDQRVDRHGALSPLSPEAGFRISLQASLADTYLLGQDDFVKASATGTKYWPLGANLVLRADLRYDEGFPLAGAVLLPEVERFFAGGDSTVRGYADDRLSTEIIRVGVPPVASGVEQLRILPSGGNIRVMGSLDAELRIYKFLATALFTDAGMITNQWNTVTSDDIKPSVGMALLRAVSPFGTLAIEYAVPLHPHLGDDPRGRFHISFAARAQF